MVELFSMVISKDTSGSSREEPGLDFNLESDSEGKDSNCTDSDTGSGLTGSCSRLVRVGFGSAILCSALQLVIGSTAGLINPDQSDYPFLWTTWQPPQRD